jgi:hypothetical protein
MGNTDLCVLVEGPAWGDAKFYGEWLLAAARTESFWKEACDDQDFEKQVDRVCICCIPDFGIAATMMLMRLREDMTRFMLHLDSEEGEDFTMLVGMGFFVRKHQSYQMTLPSCLTAEKVRAAVVEYAKTEDEEYVLHPEYLVTTMPFAEATALQDRLRAVDAACRCAQLPKAQRDCPRALVASVEQLKGGCTLYRLGRQKVE